MPDDSLGVRALEGLSSGIPAALRRILDRVPDLGRPAFEIAPLVERVIAEGCHAAQDSV